MKGLIGSTLDLRQDGELPIDLLKQTTGLEVEVGKDYTDYVGQLAEENLLSELDWLVGVTSRDPYHTQLFGNFCKLKILEYCLTKQVIIDNILVDSKGMYEAVKGICEGYNSKCDIYVNKTKQYNIVFRILYNLISSSYIALISFITPSILPGKKFYSEKPILYVDTFIKPSNFDEQGMFTDKYYEGMIDNISYQSSLNLDVCYVPVLYGIKSPIDLKWIIEKSRKSDVKFIIMEEWLRIYDYLYALFMSCFLPLKVKKIPSYNGADVSCLIKHELFKDMFSLSLFRSILVYRFIYRLKNSDLEIKQVIDWNENQVVDRALNMAIRKYYSDVRIVGYQGYIVSEYYISHSPAGYEVVARTIPDCIGVISPKLIDRKKIFYSSQKVMLAPAFRMKELLNYGGYKKGKEFIVLLALPSNIDMCANIINICLGLNVEKNIKFIVKLHPSTSKEFFFSLIPQVQNPLFEFTIESLYSFFSEAKLLISSDSSVCFEAISSGVYVVIVGGLTSITSNPVRGIFDQCYWDICYESECLQEILDVERDAFEFDVTELITPVTKKTVKTFLECNI